MAIAQDLRATGDRIEGLLEELRVQVDPSAWTKAEALLRLVTELYGAALERVVDLVGAEAVVKDELVASLLILHGLHPDDLATRVNQALESVRPYLATHGGDVEVLSIDEEAGVVRLRLLGSCDGCPSSSVTLELAVEEAIFSAAPEVNRIEAEGGASEVEKAGMQGIPVQLGHKPQEDDGIEWAPLFGLNSLPHGRLAVVEVAEQPIFVCRVRKDLFAYRDACPACSASFRDSKLEGEVLRCPVCGAAFDVRLAGRSLDGRPEHLDPLPLVDRAAGGLQVAVPVGAAS
jgi:Fe-S cluster biogenesis protein NfuA/nitrite reductase/ring-hydroxylating ferredoxin subunit